MKSNKGFIELRSVQDYWKKVQHDYEELLSDSQNTYKVFNFFVTAYHLIDWIFEGESNDDRRKLQKSTIPLLCGHIANGGKHFNITRPTYKSETELEKNKTVAKGILAPGIISEPILVHLDNKELIEKHGVTVEIKDIAKDVIEFWQDELIKRGLIN